MSQAAIKSAAMTGVAVLLTLLVVNSIAKRVPAVAKVKQAVDAGI